MFSTIFKNNFKYQNEKVNKIQKELDKIYNILIKEKSKEKEALTLLDELIYDKIKLRDIPQSLTLDGSFILTFSKFWMIIILTTLPQIEELYDKVNKFIELINISFFQDLNEKNEYRKFFEDLCEEFFTDDDAINAINQNKNLKKKLTKSDNHIEIRKHYIYLLNKPFSFENNFSVECKLNGKKEINNLDNKVENNIIETINSFNDVSKNEKKNINNDIQIKKSENDCQKEESEEEEEKENKKNNKKKKLKSIRNKKKMNKDKKNPKKKKINKNQSEPIKIKNKKYNNISLSEELSNSFLKELEDMKKKKTKKQNKNNNSNEGIENNNNSIFHSNSSKSFDEGNYVNLDSNQLNHLNDLFNCSINDLDFSTEL